MVNLVTNDVSVFVEPPVITNRPPSQVSVAQGSTLSLCCELLQALLHPRCTGHVLNSLPTQHWPLSTKDAFK